MNTTTSARPLAEKKPDDEGWGRGDRPVIRVSWHDAVAYTKWLSKQTGQDYRLPTEAEWEYAARAGTETPFWTGCCVTTAQANYNGNYGYGTSDCGARTEDYRAKTTSVGSFTPNPWKLHDTMGNVWEWTCSVYDENYGGAELKCANSDTFGAMAVRGGSWSNRLARVRSAGRGWDTPTYRFNYLGFRLARSI
ncbi:formylglycine-generating enzyme family protein [Candidatus Competibacter phosphatis]|uniref:formylglycine-generating enzyme family protein n=1 Tax=Candidatus Competibacter phosphatis TaxID=221280 RepID=UPI00248460DE|nr:formylglycine-generating enzyme family protein [Candidatus Competibacter phosphatis]